GAADLSDRGVGRPGRVRSLRLRARLHEHRRALTADRHRSGGDTMDLGERIQHAWQVFVRRAISGEKLRAVVDEIEWGEDLLPDGIYFYVVIGKYDGEPTIIRFAGPMTPHYFEGAGGDKLVAAIPIYAGMTKL